MASHDFYDLFQVPPDAGQAQIRRAYRDLARRYHPDVSQKDSQIFRLVTEAYAVLSDPAKRNDYNRLQGYNYYDDSKVSELMDCLASTIVEAGPSILTRRTVAISANCTLQERADENRSNDLKLAHRIAMLPQPSAEPTDSAVSPWGAKNEAQGVVGRLLGLLRTSRNDDRRRLKTIVLEQHRREAELRHDSSSRNKSVRSGAPQPRTDAPNAPAPERVFRFYITGAEAATGTSRQAVIPGPDGGHHRLDVKIPAGTKSGDEVELAIGWERYQGVILVNDD